jgi:hypothetical protein
MANLTIVIDDHLLQAAQVKALQQGTSIEEICRDAIQHFVRPANKADDLMAQWREASQHVQPPPPGERAWPGREALYEEVLAQRLRGGVATEERSAPENDIPQGDSTPE